VDVLDHEEDGRRLGESFEKRQDPAEELDLFELVARSRPPLLPEGREESPEGRHDSHQRGRERSLLGPGPEVAECIDERDVGEPDLAGFHASTYENPKPTPLGSIGELDQEPGLADSGIASDERDGPTALCGLIEKVR
jgi:hypothetical protein